MKNFIFSIVLLAAISTFYFLSCEKDMGVSQNPSNPDVIVINTTQTNCVQIIAGQNIVAGELCFDDVDTDNNGYDDMLKVTYTTTNDWELTEAHFHIAPAYREFP